MASGVRFLPGEGPISVLNRRDSYYHLLDRDMIKNAPKIFHGVMGCRVAMVSTLVSGKHRLPETFVEGFHNKEAVESIEYR
jgi:hypothetical protein